MDRLAFIHRVAAIRPAIAPNETITMAGLESRLPALVAVSVGSIAQLCRRTNPEAIYGDEGSENVLLSTSHRVMLCTQLFQALVSPRRGD